MLVEIVESLPLLIEKSPLL